MLHTGNVVHVVGNVGEFTRNLLWHSAGS